MKSAFVNSSLNYLIKNNVCNSKQINIFRYTLESLYSFISKTSIVLFLALIFNTFFITFGIILLYSLLRGFAFGLHASKNIYCWIITLLVYSVGPLLIQFIHFPMFGIKVSYILSSIFIILWAPADTPSRPLTSKKKRRTNKIIAFILTLILIACAFIVNKENFYEMISFLLILESICICPITYKIFKIPYNNYKYFKNN